jgi:hypothetical protein
MGDLEPGLGGGRLRLVVEHHEHGLAARAVLAHAVTHARVLEQVVADVLHRLELVVLARRRNEHARVVALERVEVVDVEEVPQPAIDAEQVERGRRDEVDRRLVRAEERADLGDPAQRRGRLGHGLSPLGPDPLARAATRPTVGRTNGRTQLGVGDDCRTGRPARSSPPRGFGDQEGWR